MEGHSETRIYLPMLNIKDKIIKLHSFFRNLIVISAQQNKKRIKCKQKKLIKSVLQNTVLILLQRSKFTPMKENGQ